MSRETAPVDIEDGALKTNYDAATIAMEAAVPSTPLPAPIFYDNVLSPLSTKKDMMKKTPNRSTGSVPRLSKSMPAVGRTRSRINDIYTRHPKFVSFTGEQDDVLSKSKTFDPASSDNYFEQCFTIIRKIGAGSFGEVFAVRSKDDLKTYAIKRSIEAFRSSADRQQKLREVEKHQTVVHHPNLVRFVRAWEERGLLYIQTELCDRSLEQLVSDSESFVVPEEAVWSWCYDLLQAVDYLHSHNLVHVDIKPANIFITSSGACKLGDFGLMMDLTKDKMANADEGDSKYLALEVLNGTPNKTSDIFSLGITILELSSGLFLPSYGTGWEMLRKAQIPEEFFTGLSSDLISMTNRMMDAAPVNRPTARDLLRHPRFVNIFTERQITLIGQCCFWLTWAFSYVISLLVNPIEMMRYTGRSPLNRRRRCLAKNKSEAISHCARKGLFASESFCSFVNASPDISFSEKSIRSKCPSHLTFDFDSDMSSQAEAHFNVGSPIMCGTPKSSFGTPQRRGTPSCGSPTSHFGTPSSTFRSNMAEMNFHSPQKRARRADDVYSESSDEEENGIIRNAATMPVKIPLRARTRTGLMKVGRLDFSKVE